MSAFFDPVILQAAIDLAIDHPRFIPDLIRANGEALEDVGMVDSFAEILRYLDDLFIRGRVAGPIDRDLMASQLPEMSLRHKGRDDWRDILLSFQGNRPPGAFQVFAQRLAELRFKQRLAEAGRSAENGSRPADLIELCERAKADLSASAAADPLPTVDFSGDPPVTPAPLVGDAAQQLMTRPSIAERDNLSLPDPRFQNDSICERAIPARKKCPGR